MEYIHEEAPRLHRDIMTTGSCYIDLFIHHGVFPRSIQLDHPDNISDSGRPGSRKHRRYTHSVDLVP